MTPERYRAASDEMLEMVNTLAAWRREQSRRMVQEGAEEIPPEVLHAMDAGMMLMRGMVFAAARKATEGQHALDCPACGGSTDFVVGGALGGCPTCGRGRPGGIRSAVADEVFGFAE